MAHSKYVYLNGEIVPWADAKVHVFSPVTKYAAGVFEGIRGYWNEQAQQLYVFRLPEHAQRLCYSQKAMRFSKTFASDDICAQVLALLRANECRENVHVRAMVYLGGEGEMDALGPTDLAITAVARPSPAWVRDGCRAQVSSWLRVSDRAMPMRIKSNANYQNGRLASVQARMDGYDTAIFLNDRGKLSEGPGMCLFMIRNGVPITPTLSSDILESITRETVLTLLAEQLGCEPLERDMDRSEIPAADEMFFCGTGWEITPIINVDGSVVGDGKPGPITMALQQAYMDVVHGRDNAYANWRTPLYGAA